MSLSTPSSLLYAGEKLSVVNNAPTITYFKRGDPRRPLAVCIPGGAHFARIFYGGHKGGRSEDFLGYWLANVGYNFLAISYPVESEPAIMPASNPDFTVREWGAQAAEVTQQIITEGKLSNSVILLVWSMAGKIIQPYALAAKAHNFTVDFVVSLVATPALRGLRERPGGITASPTGYVDIGRANEEHFLVQLHEQNSHNEGRCIIPDDVYLREYIAKFPIELCAWGLKWSPKERKLIKDKAAGYEVADETPFSDMPFLCSIYGNSPTDLRHSIGDKYMWGFLLTYKLFAAITKDTNALLLDDREKGKRFIKLIQEAPERFTAALPGGHHIFVGERGAKATAELVVEFEKRIEALRRELLTEIEAR